MTHVLFSVVIPCYNSSEYLAETLQSLSKQTYKNFEVIVVDDISTDNSFELCKELLLTFHLPGKAVLRGRDMIKGVASCRNYGISLAQGDYICFLDSDDLFLPNKLQQTSDAIAASSSSAFFHGVRYFKDKSNETLMTKTVADTSTISSDLFKGNFICTSTVTVKKTLLQELGGFNTQLHGVEDYLMWLRVSKKTNWHYLSSVLTDYRVRESSLMGNRDMAYYVGQGKALVDIVKNSKEFSSDEKKLVDHYMLNDSMNYYSSISLSTKGRTDFIKGLLALHKAGKTGVGIRLLYEKLRHLILKKISTIYKKIVP